MVRSEEIGAVCVQGGLVACILATVQVTSDTPLLYYCLGPLSVVRVVATANGSIVKAKLETVATTTTTIITSLRTKVGCSTMQYHLCDAARCTEGEA